MFFVLMVVIIAKLIPDSPLFYFIGPERWLMLVRLALVGGMIWVSFNGYIRRPKTRHILNRVGLVMLGLGAVTFMAIQLSGYLFDFFKPLDVLLLVEAGAIFSLASLADKPQSAVKARKTSVAG